LGPEIKHKHTCKYHRYNILHTFKTCVYPFIITHIFIQMYVHTRLHEYPLTCIHTYMHSHLHAYPLTCIPALHTYLHTYPAHIPCIYTTLHIYPSYIPCMYTLHIYPASNINAYMHAFTLHHYVYGSR
jgi:hypothetical protein